MTSKEIPHIHKSGSIDNPCPMPSHMGASEITPSANGECSHARQLQHNLPRIPELDDHTYLVALPRKHISRSSTASLDDRGNSVLIAKPETPGGLSLGDPVTIDGQADDAVEVGNSQDPSSSVKDIDKDTCLVISVSTNDHAQLLRLQDYTHAEALQTGILGLWKLRLECVESVSVRYRWWSERALGFRLNNAEDFEFLLERVKRYDGNKGNCVVELHVNVKKT